MDKILLLFIGLLMSHLQAQSTFSFKEKIHLNRVQNKFYTQSGKAPLQYVNVHDKRQRYLKNFVTEGKDGVQNFYEVDSVVDYRRAKVFVIDTLQVQYSKLSGEMIFEGSKLFFYPRLEKHDDVKYDNLLKEHLLFFDIPERSNMDVHYSSWHVGLLTLPLKFYMSSRSDSIKNNVMFDANINVMLGKKWGTKRYYNSPGSQANSMSTKSWSVNLVLGVSKVELDIYNTKPVIGTVKTTVTNLSYGLAFGYQLNRFGFFVATGIDSPLSTLGKNWNLSNQPWVGVGLGLGVW